MIPQNIKFKFQVNNYNTIVAVNEIRENFKINKITEDNKELIGDKSMLEIAQERNNNVTTTSKYPGVDFKTRLQWVGAKNIPDPFDELESEDELIDLTEENKISKENEVVNYPVRLVRRALYNKGGYVTKGTGKKWRVKITDKQLLKDGVKNESYLQGMEVEVIKSKVEEDVESIKSSDDAEEDTKVDLNSIIPDEVDLNWYEDDGPEFDIDEEVVEEKTEIGTELKQAGEGETDQEAAVVRFSIGQTIKQMYVSNIEFGNNLEIEKLSIDELKEIEFDDWNKLHKTTKTPKNGQIKLAEDLLMLVQVMDQKRIDLPIVYGGIGYMNNTTLTKYIVLDLCRLGYRIFGFDPDLDNSEGNKLDEAGLKLYKAKLELDTLDSIDELKDGFVYFDDIRSHYKHDKSMTAEAKKVAHDNVVIEDMKRRHAFLEKYKPVISMLKETHPYIESNYERWFTYDGTRILQMHKSETRMLMIESSYKIKNDDWKKLDRKMAGSWILLNGTFGGIPVYQVFCKIIQNFFDIGQALGSLELRGLDLIHSKTFIDLTKIVLMIQNKIDKSIKIKRICDVGGSNEYFQEFKTYGINYCAANTDKSRNDATNYKDESGFVSCPNTELVSFRHTIHHLENTSKLKKYNNKYIYIRDHDITNESERKRIIEYHKEFEDGNMYARYYTKQEILNMFEGYQLVWEHDVDNVNKTFEVLLKKKPKIKQR